MAGDGQRDFDDVPAFIMALVDRPAYDLAFPLVDEETVGDINGDSTFDLGDISPFNALFAMPPAAARAVPEPSTVLLWGIGLVALLGSVRRRSS